MRLYRTDLPRPPAWPPPCDGESVSATLRYAAQRDRYGHRAHILLALVHLFCLPLAHSPGAVTFAILAVYAISRLPHTWRCYTSLMRWPLTWLLPLLFVWYALSLLWSADRAQGIDELGAMRMLLLPLLIWPVIDRVLWMIWAVLAGVFAHNLVQLMQMLSLFGIERPEPDRLRGLLHPIQTGAWCSFAMCWHLAAVFQTQRLWRWLSLAGFLVAVAGLIATGSRGPWLAALVVIVPGLLVFVAMKRPTRSTMLTLSAVVLIPTVLCATIGRPYIVDRIDAAQQEFRQAIDSREYLSSVGLRIGMWRWALEITQKSPWIGTGAGSFEHESRQLADFQQALERWPRNERHLARSQPHSSHLQFLQSTGIIGLALFWSVLILTLRGSLRSLPDHPYAWGTPLVALTWIIGAQFDSYHLSGTLMGALMLVVCFSLPYLLHHRESDSSYEQSDDEPSPRTNGT
jgi:O-antigen ligase